METKSKIKEPLLLKFLTPISNVDSIKEPTGENTFYNAGEFNVVPFYKSISLLIGHQNILRQEKSSKIST
ncbi:hypothetical protein [Mucilaginibacter sp. CSA2-8R]|uniref:hypothetical protein n=1 Tax=Mucilaginibacter sp. CSA2-8R TaxID=3141542 RepID=UPI00315D4DC6